MTRTDRIAAPTGLLPGIGLLLGACGSVTALPSLPTEDAQAGLLVQAGSEPAVFAFALGPGQPPPGRAPFEAVSVPPLAWLTFSCPLSTLSLSPGRLALKDEEAELLRLPPAHRTYVYDDGAWAERPPDPELASLLRRLPLGESTFCPGSVRGVEVEARLLSGGDPGDEIAFSRILPLGHEALVLRGIAKNVERPVDSSTTPAMETVRRIIGGQLHQLALGRPTIETTLRADADTLPYLEGSADFAGVTLWGRGRFARFEGDLMRPTIVDAPELSEAESIRAVAWVDFNTELAVVLVDDQPRLVNTPVADDARRRRLRILGFRDGALEELLRLELPLADPPVTELTRLDDGAVLIRGLGENDSKKRETAQLVRWRDGSFAINPQVVPKGRLIRVEGRTYILGGMDQAYVYEGGLFAELPDPPTWPFLERVERQATLGGRALFHFEATVAERVDEDTVCPSAQLGRDEWAAVTPWGDAWAFLERGENRRAGLFLARPSRDAPACAASEGED